jgi:ABC-type nitrate/sulfonate/bicarbonate transport system permease component
MKENKSSPLVWPLRALGLGALLGVWAFGNGPGGISPLVLPTISRVVEALGEALSQFSTYEAAAITFGEILAAFILASVFGLAAGFWAARTPLRMQIFQSIFVWGYLAPLILFYPIFILSFGTGVGSKIGYGAVSAFFPIAYNSLRAFATVQPTMLKVARAFGASSFQTDFLIKLPGALPLISSGVRIGAGASMITVIFAEMLASTAGLGYQLALTSQTFAAPQAFAMIILLMVLVGVLQGLVNLLLTPRRERGKIINVAH